MKKKSIEEQFNKISKNYDGNRKKFIPCFEDFYETTTNFIATNIKPPKNVLDLGAGTGLLTYYWYKNFSKTEYLLVDIANKMLEVAKKRFCNLENIKYDIVDYNKTLLNNKFDCVISALSIHHLEDVDKDRLFSNIYNLLPDGGIFVNYDQFCCKFPKIDKWINTYWINGLKKSGLSHKDISLWEERKKLDKECSVEDEIEMLKKCHFQEVQVIYSNQKFSVIVAIK